MPYVWAVDVDVIHTPLRPFSLDFWDYIPILDC